MRATVSGPGNETCVSLPFGDGLSCRHAGEPIDPVPMHFTGQEHDPYTGLEHFPARYDSSAWGRFVTPDWSAAPSGVPYASFADPQSLDLYLYALDNPATNIDPSGHVCFMGLLGNTCAPGKAPDPPPPPPAPAIADLHTSIKGGYTEFQSYTPKGGYEDVKIGTLVKAVKGSLPGAGGPYKTDNIVGVSGRHGGKNKAYGPLGAFIDTGDPRGRDIHGGGSSLGKHAFDPRQRLTPTDGCTRGCNADVIKLGEAVTAFKKANPDTAIPYSRTEQ